MLTWIKFITDIDLQWRKNFSGWDLKVSVVSCFLQPAFVSHKTHQLSASEPEGLKCKGKNLTLPFKTQLILGSCLTKP